MCRLIRSDDADFATGKIARCWIALLGLLAGAACSGSSGNCPAPGGQLVVNVSSATCSRCTRLAIVAQSPQISAAISAGKSPCSEQLPAGGPVGCLMGTIWVNTFAACGGSACGPYNVDLSQEFLPVVSGAAPAITDTVAFCPFNCTSGSSCAVATKCVSSFSDQCSGTITLNM